MATLDRDGVAIHYDEHGSGDPLVLVHGAWADGRHWTRFAQELHRFRAIAYDRRGHGRSGGEHTAVDEDVADLRALIEHAGGQAHVVGGSLGGAIALRAAAEDPSPFLSLAVHEPALMGLLGGTPQPPSELPTPREFAESSLGEGAWEQLTEEEKEGFEDNGPAYAAEMADTEAFGLDVDRLADFGRPLLVTLGSESPPFWRQIADALPGAAIETVGGAAHLPHLTHARAYAQLVRGFASAAAARR